MIDKLIQRLIQEKKTITTMESCTSGMIASMITDTEGASAIFPGGYVTYANETKIAVGVDPAVIAQYGVYSRECAQAMAQTAQEKLGTDVAIGITGTTGNVDPANADSVQGQVYFCILLDGKYHSYEWKVDVVGLSRHEIKLKYVNRVFEELGRLLDK